MKKLLILNLVLSSFTAFAQPNTEVYLLDINENDGKIEFSNLRNISNNEGYDNQPSFYDDNAVLFSSTRNGQTDIAKYDITTGEISWISNTPSGSEYSPLRIPNSDDISAIRLDISGLQRLYRYDTSTGESKELVKNLKVGYHVWSDKNLLISTVLVDDGMDLVVSNLTDGSNRTVQKLVGRSLHKIPNSELFSFTKLEDDPFSIKSLNPTTSAVERIIPIPSAISDICWLSNGTLLAGDGNAICKFNPKTDEKWEIIWKFDAQEIYQISRMAVSPNGKNLALVSNPPPASTVQKQVESYNVGNLEAFVSCYAEDVLVRNFPVDTLYIGHEKMRDNYSSLSPEKKVYAVEVVKRITIGNKVIDHEKVTGNGKTQMQVAAYEVNDEAISSMTFIFESEASANPEVIVQKQLDAYNARDIDGFLATYADDVQLFDFPAEKRLQGQEEMRKGYSEFFKTTPDLQCEIKKRIVIGNKVIDEELITANGSSFSAVAIYEVENGTISKVTFVQ